MSNGQKSLVLKSCITIFFLPLLLVSLDYPPEVSLPVACQQNNGFKLSLAKLQQVLIGIPWVEK